ncbi:rhomboid family intramembrane serine protease [Geodermatophilus sp. SYSU D00815]
MVPASVGFQCPECVRAGQAGVRRVRGGGVRSAGRRWGPVTLTLIAVNVAMFVVTAVSAGVAGYDPLDNYDSSVFFWLAQYPVLVDQGEVWRLVTAAFLHVGPVHLALNMLALLVFGTELEHALGRWRYLALYFLSVLGGAAAVELFSHPGVPVAGASTALYGLMGGLAVLMVARRQDLRGIVALLAINVLVSVLVPGISIVGHLGGLLAGIAATGLLVAARRSRPAQLAGVAVLAVVLLVLCLAVPTVAVL